MCFGESDMPSNVKLFLILNYLSIAIGVVQTALNFSQIMAASGSTASFGITVQVLTIGILLTIISVAGFWHQNWARWLLLVLFVAGLPVYFLTAWKTVTSFPFGMIVGLVQILMQATGFFFIFTGNARPWFKRGGAPAESVF